MQSKTIGDKIPDKRYEIKKYMHDKDTRSEMKQNDGEHKQKERVRVCYTSKKVCRFATSLRFAC